MGELPQDPDLGGSVVVAPTAGSAYTEKASGEMGKTMAGESEGTAPRKASEGTESTTVEDKPESPRIITDEKPIPKPRRSTESIRTAKESVDDLSQDLVRLSVQDQNKSVEHTFNTGMEELSKDIGKLSVHGEEKEQASGGKKPKPTLQSIIAQIEELKVKKGNRLRSHGAGKLLKAHGPPGIACFYPDVNPIQQGLGGGKRKGGPDAERNAAKFFREKGPSEQDERTGGDLMTQFNGDCTVQGELMPCFDENAGMGWPNKNDEFMNTVLWDLAGDEIGYNTLMNDICEISTEDKVCLSKYLDKQAAFSKKLATENQQPSKQYPRQTEPHSRHRQPSINQQVPNPGSPAGSDFSDQSSISSGYKTGSPSQSYISDDFLPSPLSCNGGDAFSPAPSPYTNSSSHSVSSPSHGSPHPLDLPDYEKFTDVNEIKRHLEEQVLLENELLSSQPDDGLVSEIENLMQQPAVQSMPQPQLPQVPLPPVSSCSVIGKQMIQMNQQLMYTASTTPQQQQQQQPQQQVQIQQPSGQIVSGTILQPIQPHPTPQMTCPQPQPIQVPLQPGNLSLPPTSFPAPVTTAGRRATRNCGCNHPNCEHTLIRPRPSPTNALPPSPSPLYQPAAIVHRPSETRNGDLGIKVDKEELLRARRIVASIKREDLTKRDQDGDLALHIVVVQEDRCMLIALLERCRREGIIDQVINRQNVHTQTLLFLAVLADSITNASDMVAILLEFDADPLTNTISTSSNSHDQKFHYPIHIVAGKGNGSVPIMSKLLRRRREEQLRQGCDSNQRALHYAARAHTEKPSDQMIQELLRQGADINLQEGKRGRTALHYMVETRDVELVQTVLQILGLEKAKRAVNLHTYDHCTALHIAAGLHMDLNSHRNLLRLLVHYGADVTAKNAQNQRASDLLPAESRELASILKGSSASRSPTYTPVSPPSTATYIPPSTSYVPMYVLNTQTTAAPLYANGNNLNHGVTLVTGNQQLPCLAPSLG